MEGEELQIAILFIFALGCGLGFYLARLFF